MNGRYLAGVISQSLFSAYANLSARPRKKNEYSPAPVIFHVDDCPHLNDEANNWQ